MFAIPAIYVCPFSKEGLAKYNPRVKSGPQPVFVNKVLSEHICLLLSTAALFRVALLTWRLCDPQSLQYLLSGPLQESFLTPVLNVCALSFSLGEMLKMTVRGKGRGKEAHEEAGLLKTCSNKIPNYSIIAILLHISTIQILICIYLKTRLYISSSL